MTKIADHNMQTMFIPKMNIIREHNAMGFDVFSGVQREKV